jgi:hypothetical protein
MEEVEKAVDNKHTYNCLGFHQSTQTKDDRNIQDFQSLISQKAGQYPLQQPVIDGFHEVSHLEKATCQPHVNFSGGFNCDPEHIETSNELRNAGIPRYDERPCAGIYFSTPFRGRGPGNACAESIIQFGEDTGSRQASNCLSGAEMSEYRFHPMLASVEHVQDVEHVVPESVDPQWRRGGQPSRQFTRDPRKLRQMGYRYNGKFWERARKNL